MREESSRNTRRERRKASMRLIRVDSSAMYSGNADVLERAGVHQGSCTLAGTDTCKAPSLLPGQREVRSGKPKCGGVLGVSYTQQVADR